MSPETAAEDVNRALEHYATTPVQYTVAGSLLIEHWWVTALSIIAVAAVLGIIVCLLRSTPDTEHRREAVLAHGVYGAGAGAVIFLAAAACVGVTNTGIASTTEKDRTHGEVMGTLTTLVQQRYDVVSVEPALYPDPDTTELVAEHLNRGQSARVTVTLEHGAHENWVLHYDREHHMVVLNVPHGATPHIYPSEVLAH